MPVNSIIPTILCGGTGSRLWPLSRESFPKQYLSLFPEGTRSKVDKLRTGFYFIALKSKIPIQPIGFDFEKRIVDFGKKFNPSGDIDKDMKHITSYFSKFKGKFPENGLNH